MTVQPRILFFVHDGYGLGHLRRIARVAAGIQGPCATLVVTGMREATWVVSDRCEVLRLPSWDSVKPARSAMVGKAVWMDVSYEEALRMRCEYLRSAFRAFRPNAVVVDYLPFGHNNELRDALLESSARKYFLLRGVVDTSDRPFLAGTGAHILGATFDRVLVAADPRVVNVASECDWDPLTAAKVSYVGYVAAEPSERLGVRRRYGLLDGQRWVVCSGGGGQGMEAFLQTCVELATTMPDVMFDVVFGPRGNRDRIHAVEVPNCRTWLEHRDLPAIHAASDVVVSSGGYNSIMEAVAGGACLVVRPSNSGDDDEQFVSATRLSRHFPIALMRSDIELRDVLCLMLDRAARLPRPLFPLDMDGVARIRDLMYSDLVVA